MSCVHEAIRQIYKKSSIPLPRTPRFERLSHKLYSESISASRQAEMVVLFLRKLEAIKGDYIQPASKYACVFLHPNKEAKGFFHNQPHCLGLYHTGHYIDRFCAWEDNWRSVYNKRTEFRFTTRDWTTAVKDKFIDKPFRFSYFVTSEGYSIWLHPKRVIKIMDDGIVPSHDYPYKKSWEKHGTQS